MTQFSKNLKRIRIMRNVSQEMLSRALCVGRSTISSWESGKTEPNLSTLTKIRNYLDVTYEELLDNPKGLI